ncbi:TPA: hypothetical protein KON86_002761 [Clostridioides difficile]|uniref:hypothetical protein n=1 Tax=Clostridioides TaxID=1870884 RepID=UPI001C1A6274|nr:hypothetical protein [Clostridioides difficile]MCC0648285.1 hypothetical protein [Clostridioides sp. ZZV15-6598]MBY2228977.1 hypothetical protein [Clostridioides difficile]MBY2832744.1 hypothetical protein [Clostridioides difficile]MDB3084187.1 hypothetical protein [Clostridioides difficile]MDW0092634.1 hypothetical protein [Clostridioides difficile]
MTINRIKELFLKQDVLLDSTEITENKDILFKHKFIKLSGIITMLTGLYLVSNNRIVNLFLVPGLSGIPSSSAESIGDQIIPTIQKIAQVGGAVTALVSLCIAGISLMVSKRQEQRQESMSKIMNIAGGIAVIGFAASAVGFLTGSFMK